MENLQNRIQQLTDITTDNHVSSMENDCIIISTIEETLSIVLRGRAPLPGGDEEKKNRNNNNNNGTDKNSNNNNNINNNNNNNNNNNE